MKIAVMLLLLFCGSVIFAEENAMLPYDLGDNTWYVFLNAKSMNPPAPHDIIPESLKAKAPDADPVTPITVKMENNRINLAGLNGGFKRSACAFLYHEFESSKTGAMQIGVAADWQMDLWTEGKCVFSSMAKGNETQEYTTNDHTVILPVKAGKNIVVARVLSGSAGWLFVCGKPDKPKPNLKYEANSEWKVADMNDLLVKAGSALDQSALTEDNLKIASAKRSPRLVVAPDGSLAVEGHPETPIKLRGTGIALGWALDRAFGWPNHPEKDPNWKSTFQTEIISAKRRGYNLFRFSPGWGSSPSDERVDGTDFLLSELGKSGMYCVLDFAYDKDLRKSWEPGESRNDCIWRMFLGDEFVRASWKRSAEFMMNHVNPYTGLAWKGDPTIAVALLNNEQETAFYHPKKKWAKETQVEIDVKFRGWVECKYREPKALAEAWNDKTITAFIDVVAPDNFPWQATTVMENDYLLFCTELSHKNAEWLRQTLREIGYKGLISMYNCSYWMGGQKSRWAESQVCTSNVYYNHPSAFDEPGSRCGQKSSLEGGAAYWRSAAAYRNANRPFIQTEFNHAFWNPYQHELGNVFGAYSALQGFDGLSIHAGAAFYYVWNFKPGIKVFGVGESPILRSCEFLSGCFFLRGDVKKSPHRVELQIPQEYLQKDCNGGRTVSSQQDKIALLTGFSVAFPWEKKAPGVGEASAPDLILAPGSGGGFKWAAAGYGAGAAEFVESKDEKFSMDTMVAILKEKGILPQDNITDPAGGVYQSDTGQITMRTNEHLLKIVTPRSEAVTMESATAEKLGYFEVLNTSVPALAAACAVDDKPLAESRRIVIVYATDAVNTDMEVSASRVSLVNLGKPPALIQVGKLEAALYNPDAATMSLYALGFNGERREKLPLAYDGDTVKLSIDTGVLKDGPTTFFELVKE